MSVWITSGRKLHGYAPYCRSYQLDSVDGESWSYQIPDDKIDEALKAGAEIDEDMMRRTGEDATK